MSLNFGTDNIYFVPEGERLSLFDVYNMRKVELDCAHWGLFYNKAKFPVIRKALNAALKRWEKHQKGPDETARGRQAVDSLIGALPLRKFPTRRFLNLEKCLSPQEITFWVRCSDTPLESFFEEDYTLRKPTPAHTLTVPVIGSIRLAAIGDFELSIPEVVEREGFFLEVSKENGIRIEMLPPEEMLPLDEGFFGAWGSSAQGRLINLTHDARVCEENLCCTTLHRIGSHYFATLYFHLRTKVEYNVVLKFSEKKLKYAYAHLEEIGFRLHKESARNAVFKRGDSIVHLYANVAGKETLGARFLPPFLLVTLNEGSTDPATRSKLVKDLLPRFSK